MFNPVKIVIGVIILLIIIIVVVKLTKSKNPDAKETIVAAGDYAKKLDVKYKKAAFSQAQYLGFAETLYGAMKGVGTDTEQIYFVFRQLKSDTDIYKVIEAFGVRDGDTLNKWIADELDSNERLKLFVITSKYAAYRF